MVIFRKMKKQDVPMLMRWYYVLLSLIMRSTGYIPLLSLRMIISQRLLAVS